ncbi:heparinase II/III family protein [Paucibacter sp. APW11]|uniref:Heparinase II/III family protein n=1 Tax=Roseateles aquae TaxID=3077235 RepID=A0ABU3PGT0_9BURK|nr:heparinase II/III family protein [Paucibacter sp. APW11]MDT9001333.1 heparinase II/III family protein [Paucibacter sp. APW11]
MTTASSAKALAAPSAGVFYGQREAREDWTGLAARVKSSTDVANWLKAQKADVDAWMAKNPERADMVGGWVQNYLDPKTGALVTWTVDSPEPARAASTAEQKYYEGWVAYVRGYNIARTQMAARIYRLTGDTKYGEWAAKQLDFYAKNYKTWPLRTFNGRGQMYRHGLDEAYDSFTLVDAARLLESYAGSARNQAWRDGLFLPMATNLKTVTTPMSNIALWHYAAISGIALRFKDTTLLDYGQNHTQGLLATLRYGVTADNLWIEGTFAYNDYVVDAMSKLLTQASLEGRSSTFQAERDFTLRLMLAAFDYRFADNMLPTPSDSSAKLPVATPAVHWKLFRVLPTYYGVDLANRWRTWESLLDPPSATPSAPTLPTVYTRNFPSIRMAVLKSGNWQAFFHYGQATGNHAQEEALAYELYDGTTQISTDSGTVSYTSPYHTDYFSRGPANNVALIDGLGQSSWGKGDVTDFTASANRLVAQHTNYRPGVTVSRGLRVTSAGMAEQTSINVNSTQAGIPPASKRLGIAFHSACQISPQAGLSTAPAVALPSAIGLSYWKETKMWTAGTNWTVSLVCGSKSYTLSVSGPANQRVYLSRAPTTPLPTLRNVLYYEAVGTAASYSSEIKPLVN